MLNCAHKSPGVCQSKRTKIFPVNRQNAPPSYSYSVQRPHIPVCVTLSLSQNIQIAHACLLVSGMTSPHSSVCDPFLISKHTNCTRLPPCIRCDVPTFQCVCDPFLISKHTICTRLPPCIRCDVPTFQCPGIRSCGGCTRVKPSSLTAAAAIPSASSRTLWRCVTV